MSSSSIGRLNVRHGGASAASGFGARRGPVALSIVKLLFVALANLPFLHAAPLSSRLSPISTFEDEDLPKQPGDPGLWAYLGTGIALVLLGGVFAGLTIALMGQDEIYLQVIATSGEGSEKKNAARVLRLLKKGKHWVLVTLLLSNVITNETLPIVLDRSLGGGWPAVLSSTVLIVIFGEIAPQSVCVRYGLPIGAWMSPFVLALMWLMAPVAWPTAKLLDWLLGEDHGTVYKKAGLKTLVTLHKTLGTTPGERLNEDEVTIISAVLDLKDKPVGDIMTPMQDVFTMSADTILDEKMMDTILSQGYSRIPIYAPDNPRNFIGMLLVKILITYDPEDAMRVRDFALATLPETAPETSCLDIVNFFQEGKSHMVLVSDFPGQDKGALGVVTLEDVIEELIGEEIIDESDVFVDVHKAIRRMTPAPRMRYTRGITAVPKAHEEEAESDADVPDERRRLLPKAEDASSRPSRKSSLTETPREATFLMRRRSSGGSGRDSVKPLPVRSNTTNMREHLRHLGPSNVASRPKTTKYSSVKIKPGVGTIPENRQLSSPAPTGSSQPSETLHNVHINGDGSAPEGGADTDLLTDAGKDAKDGAIAVATGGYGTMSSSPSKQDHEQNDEEIHAEGEPEQDPHHMTAAEASAFASQHASPGPARHHLKVEEERNVEEHQHPDKLVIDKDGSSRPVSRRRETSSQSQSSSRSHSTVGEMEGGHMTRKYKRAARSGSITETTVNVGGMRKVVLETTSSSDTEDAKKLVDTDGTNDQQGQEHNDGNANDDQQSGSKKKKKKKRGGKKVRSKMEGRSESQGDENSPLLGHD